MNTAVYPGTFDPITYGHIDLVHRAAKCFDRLVIAVAQHPHKHTLFSMEERVELVRQSLPDVPNLEVDQFDGLLVDYVQTKGARVIVRGQRAFSDFEYEFQMALTNRKLAPNVETLFLMPKEEYSYVSSSLVREVAALKGDIQHFVPAPVVRALRDKAGH